MRKLQEVHIRISWSSQLALEVLKANRCVLMEGAHLQLAHFVRVTRRANDKRGGGCGVRKTVGASEVYSG